MKLGDGLILAEFEEKSDKVRVLCNGMWNFDKSLVLIKEFDRSQQVRQICMKEASFWVRDFDLPLLVRNKYVGGLIGAAPSKLEEVNLLDCDIERGEFMRLQVCIDMTKPL